MTKIKSIILLITTCFVLVGCATATDSHLTKEMSIKKSDKTVQIYKIFDILEYKNSKGLV